MRVSERVTFQSIDPLCPKCHRTLRWERVVITKSYVIAYFRCDGCNFKGRSIRKIRWAEKKSL